MSIAHARRFASLRAPRLLSLALVAMLARQAPTARAQDAPTYRTPPAPMADLLAAPRLPRGTPNVSPDGGWLLQPDLRSLIPIATLAEPVEKLAGLEILPGLRANRRDLKTASAGLSFVSIADGHVVRAKLPADSRIGPVAWSNRGDRIALARFASDRIELWIVNAADGSARPVEGVRLQGVPSPWIEWANDDASVFCAVVPDTPLPDAGVSRVPGGPAVRASTGRAAPQRTSRDVLRTPADQARFAAYVSARIVRVPADGGVPAPIGSPVPLASVALSPDEQWLLVRRFATPAPTGFPYALFPTVTELWPLAGGAPVRIAESPLNDRSATASVAPLGAREFTWAPDGRSLWAASWEDRPGADPGAAVRDTTLPPPGRDRIVRWEAPFTTPEREVASAAWPIDALVFDASGTHLLVSESYEPRRLERQWWFAPADPRNLTVLLERSSEGVYDAPGTPLTRDLRHGEWLWTTLDGKSFWRRGDGYRPEGQRPFLDRCAFAGGRPIRVFESAAAKLEDPVALLDGEARRTIVLTQSATEPPNYVVRAAGGLRTRALTAYENPMRALAGVQRQQFEFARADGVKLHAEAVLPADWAPGRRLPTVFWIYPNDYRSAAAASQNRTSPNRFPSQSALNPEVLVTQGYAVVKPDLAVVGTNDQYVEELRKSAQAAVDACVERGFADRERIAVAGHSYGAFSTVNCLAHTNLFRAGLASDGAYNRTLTPFTFQAETRNLWEARGTYLEMSPFLYANDIHAPLLLMHNQDDTNVGTNPIQSDRLFEALNGLGKTCQLVQYPFEDHGPVARETVLDYWARALEWFDRYVKNPPTAKAGKELP